MKVSDILNDIDRGYMGLPEFQRDYVWTRAKVKTLFESLYNDYPIGELLVWTTNLKNAPYRGTTPISREPADLILDGQQRVTTLYAIIRGKVPGFFEGNKNIFLNFCFSVKEEKFAFLTPNRIKQDPTWVNLTRLLDPETNISDVVESAVAHSPNTENSKDFFDRAINARNIAQKEIHVENISFDDINIVVDIFNRVNSAGTTLSPGALALAKITAKYPSARKDMKKNLERWKRKDYNFRMDWLLRSVNVVINDKSKFSHLHDVSAGKFKDGLNRASKYIDASLELISGRLGLDHSDLLQDKMAMPVIVWYMNKKNGKLNHKEENKLLYWFAQASIWGHFSSSIESVIDQDVRALKEAKCDIQILVDHIQSSRESLLLEPASFDGSKNVKKFYSILYMITKMGEARDLMSGVKIRNATIGKRSKMQRHHIFPKAQLIRNGYDNSEVNELGNFCFLTEGSNRNISDNLPEIYLAEVEDRHPGVLKSQWIPSKRKLWKIDRYLEFLEERKKLLAAEANRCLSALLD